MPTEVIRQAPAKLLVMPLPEKISSERWSNFLRARVKLDDAWRVFREHQSRLETAEAAWQAESNAIMSALLAGADIEDGGSVVPRGSAKKTVRPS